MARQVPTVIEIDEDLRKRLELEQRRRRAAKAPASLSAIVEDAVRWWLEEENDGRDHSQAG